MSSVYYDFHDVDDEPETSQDDAFQKPLSIKNQPLTMATPNFALPDGSFTRVETQVPKWQVPHLTEGGFDADKHKTCRSKLKHVLHHKLTHQFLMFLLMLDILAVIVDIYLEIEEQIESVEFLQEQLHACALGHEFDDHVPHSWQHEVLEKIRLASVAILCVFVFEHFLLMIAMGCKYFKSFWYLMDYTVVLVSLGIELFGHEEEKDLGGALVILRAWRFIRITYGVVETKRDAETSKFLAVVLKHKDEINSWLDNDTQYEGAFPSAVKHAMSHLFEHDAQKGLPRRITETVYNVAAVVRSGTSTIIRAVSTQQPSDDSSDLLHDIDRSSSGIRPSTSKGAGYSGARKGLMGSLGRGRRVSNNVQSQQV